MLYGESRRPSIDLCYIDLQARKVVHIAKEKALLLTFGDDDTPLALRLFLGESTAREYLIFKF